MSQVLEVTVPGQPQPKERHRSGKGKAYTPQKTREAERRGMLFAKAAMRAQKVQPFEGACSLSVQFFRKRKVTARPDLDNYVKLVKDFLEKAGAFVVGDEQVVTCFAGKFYSEKEETVIVLADEVRDV